MILGFYILPMKKYISLFIIWIFGCLSLTVFADTWNNKDNIQDTKIESIVSDLSWIKNDYEHIDQKILDYYDRVVGSANSIISNGLTNQSNMLTMFSVIWSIVWIWIWLYVSYVWYKVKNIKDDSEKLLNLMKDISEWCKANIINAKEYLESSKKTLEETEIIQKEIENYPDKIYQRILDAETQYIFNRLGKYPRDISNFFTKLATREVDKNYFSVYRENWNSTTDDDYQMLSYQHMPSDLFVSDDAYWGWFLLTLNTILSCAYGPEIEFSSKEIIKTYFKEAPKYEIRLKEYLTWLIRNNKLEEPLCNSLIDSLDTDEQKEIIRKMIDNLKNPPTTEPTVKIPEPTVKIPEPTVKIPEPTVKIPEPTVKIPEQA